MIKLELSWEEVKQLTGHTQDTFKKKFPALFAEDGELKEDAEVAKPLIQAVKTKRDEFGAQKWRTSREELETHLKAIGIEDFEKAEEGLKKLAERLKGDPGNDPDSKLTDDEVKNHPIYVAAVKALKDKNEALTTEFSTYKTNVETEGKQTARKQSMLQLLKSDELKAGFGTHGEDIALQAFFALYPNYYIADGKIVDEKGQVIQDEDHNDYTAVDFLKKKWIFGLNVAPDGETPPPPGQGGSGGIGSFKITSTADYERFYEQHLSDPKKLIQLETDYMAFLSKQ